MTCEISDGNMLGTASKSSVYSEKDIVFGPTVGNTSNVHLQQHAITPLQQMASACSGALLTSILTTPFDVVKVRLQAQQQFSSFAKPCFLIDCKCLDGVSICDATGQISSTPKFKGTFDAFVKIAELEGISSWWKGLSPTLLMALPSTVIYYSTYDMLKMKFGFKPDEVNIVAPLLSGSLARSIAVTAVCPIELLRTKLQAQHGYSFKEVVGVLSAAVRTDGLFSLWRGLFPMLLRDVPFSIAYWIGYEYFKLKFTICLEPQYYPVVPFAAGSLSGIIAAVLTNPLDVVKTHVQVDLGKSGPNSKRLGAGSLATVVRKIVSKHGIAGLYAGLVPRCVKIAPACAIMITSYEACRAYFSEHNHHTHA